MINQQNLGLLKEEKGKSNKLLARYEGPFEIMKISAVAYQLCMSASYGMDPVLSIEPLEKYQESPNEFGDHPQLQTNRASFDILPEYEVNKIVAEHTQKGRNRQRILIYHVRYTNYGPEGDTWETRQNLKNTPDVLLEWEKFKAFQKKKSRTMNKEYAEIYLSTMYSPTTSLLAHSLAMKSFPLEPTHYPIVLPQLG